MQTHFTPGYEWPTSILVNLALEGRALGHITSSTDFKMPYTFAVELMGDVATLRHDMIQWQNSFSWERLAAANPFHDVVLKPINTSPDSFGSPNALRILCSMPGSADVSHHPFQDEIDEFVDCVRRGRDTSISVFDAQKTMEICLAADESASSRGVPVKLPLIAD
jgi:predicted dehydrogenase